MSNLGGDVTGHAAKRLVPLWAIYIVHAALVMTTLSPRDELWSRPIGNFDYPLHFYNARHMADRLRDAGRLWGYDPGWMAGYPESPLGLIDNKLFAVVLLFAPSGWKAVAFNATVLLALLCVPWVLHRGALTAGSSPFEADGAALAGTALLFAAPLTVHFWATGMISFVLASVLVVPAALGLANAIEEERVLSARAIGAYALAAAAVFVHTLLVIPLGAALIPAAWTAVRRRRFRSVVALFAPAIALALTILPVVSGLENNVAQIRPLPPTGGAWLPGGLNAFFFDWWVYLLPNLAGAGAGSLAAVVLLAIIGLAVAPVAKERAAPRRAVIAAMIACTLLAYFAPTFVSRLNRLQPHRFSITFGLFAAIFAGSGVAWLAGSVRKGNAAASALTLLLLVVVVQPGWILGGIRPLGSGVDAAEEKMTSFLAESVRDDGRVLVEIGLMRAPAVAGSARRINKMRFTLLPLHHDREFLGTDHVEQVVAQRYTAFYGGRMFGRRLETIDAPSLRALLDLYAVSAVVACAPETRAALDRFADVIAPVRDLADCRGYRVRDAETSRLVEGRAAVRARLDRIEVRGAEGERIVLKYHWTPTLRTEPPLPIDEAPLAGAPVGFIRVRPRGVRDFDIVVVPSGIGELVFRRLRRIPAISRGRDSPPGAPPA